MAGDQFDVAEPVVRTNGCTGEHEVGSRLHSNDPLSLVTRDDDPQWSDFANWVVQGLLTADEERFGQNSSGFATTNLFGEEYKSMFVDALSTVGNYGEIYARHLEPIVPRANVNQINSGDSALMYSLPFGDVESDGPEPITGGTIEKIKKRGFLRCGIARRSIFAVSDGGAWTGFDIDFCKAVSAALLYGRTDNVVYVDLPATERFKRLHAGEVDMLSRITTVNFLRDVNETDTGVGFSFARPNFYDGMSFGGRFFPA